jgi:hypothetical protein
VLAGRGGGRRKGFITVVPPSTAQGVPGFAFAVVRRDLLQAAKGNAGSVALDLHEQWAHMSATNQFR